MGQIKFDMDMMKKRCLDPFESFQELGLVSGKNIGDRTIFIDRGSNVLSVAHLDTVNSADVNHFEWFYIKKALHVYNGQLDDRLGAYVVIDLLPQLGINCDVLLTEGEETGHSTADLFHTSKQYNWMFSFDRTGYDAVMYQYWTQEYANMLKSYGWKVERGSFSDIAFLDHLECTGVNFGVGYYNYHSEYAYANLEHTARSLSYFMAMWPEVKDTKMPFNYKSSSSGWAHAHPHHWRRGYYSDDEYTGYGSPQWYGSGSLRPKQNLSELKARLASLEKKQETQEEIDKEEAARLEAALEGTDLDGTIECAVCHHHVISTDYSFRYDMCCFCVDDINWDVEHPASKAELDSELEAQITDALGG